MKNTMQKNTKSINTAITFVRALCHGGYKFNPKTKTGEPINLEGIGFVKNQLVHVKQSKTRTSIVCVTIKDAARVLRDFVSKEATGCFDVEASDEGNKLWLNAVESALA